MIFVLEDYGEIVGVLACEPDGHASYFINLVVATRRDRQREHLAEDLFRAVLAQLDEIHQPDGCHVWWKVKLLNFGSQNLSEKLGAEETHPPDEPGLLHYELWTR